MTYDQYSIRIDDAETEMTVALIFRFLQIPYNHEVINENRELFYLRKDPRDLNTFVIVERYDLGTTIVIRCSHSESAELRALLDAIGRGIRSLYEEYRGPSLTNERGTSSDYVEKYIHRGLITNKEILDPTKDEVVGWVDNRAARIIRLDEVEKKRYDKR
ncbi:hypothetical protein [Mechercharimyces sp. CAU 1602]|uniref:hypothetical protein n=1 Tax=Mechercharimyces sp. CAU 1602 TaxID=2973933 RepID=UPI002162D357|nr:hypothetical protein [Mechercharimyces sp. CAU 1602]MCS1351878.1 hypothetical protein [Mechercharimyces sp. CAU 1602]